jgi:CheY-like chemotaxis protein
VRLADASTLRVLAAEDNAINQLVLRTLLGQAGVDLLVVEDGAKALEAWRRQKWDLVLMDVQMPVMDGLSAARAIRQEEALHGLAATPIIALTANAMAHQIAEYVAAGMSSFVAKPIRVEELFEAMQAALVPSAAAEIQAVKSPSLAKRAR